MARSNQVVAFKQNDDGTQTFTVGAQSATFHPDLVHASLRIKAELHGWKQRISDKAAIGRDPKTGKSASPEEKFKALAAMIAHLESGTDKWELTRTGGGGGRSEASYILEALANIQSLSVEDMEERVTRMAEKHGITTDAYLKRVGTTDAVAKEVARIKHGDAEDGDALLDELAGDDEQDESDEDGDDQPQG